MRFLALFAVLWLAAADDAPTEDGKTRERRAATTVETSPERRDDAEGRRDTFVPSERIGAETTVSFPADI